MKKKRGTKKGIVRSTRAPKWQTTLRTALREFRQNLWNALAGVGLVTVIVLLVRAWGGG